jgi:uncharacterized protein
MSEVTVLPWYREPWPWILMVAPGAAVVGGIAMLTLAVTTSDGLVAEDYYKQGLTVNQQLARAHKAQELGIGGELTIDTYAGGAIRAQLHGQLSDKESLVLVLSHPTRAGLDQHLTLQPAGNGLHVGRFDSLAAGRWHVIIENAGRDWRIRGQLQVPQQQSARLVWGS